MIAEKATAASQLWDTRSREVIFETGLKERRQKLGYTWGVSIITGHAHTIQNSCPPYQVSLSGAWVSLLHTKWASCCADIT